MRIYFGVYKFNVVELKENSANHSIRLQPKNKINLISYVSNGCVIDASQ